VVLNTFCAWLGLIQVKNIPSIDIPIRVAFFISIMEKRRNRKPGEKFKEMKAQTKTGGRDR
jgi:hypothetical protein